MSPLTSTKLFLIALSILCERKSQLHKNNAEDDHVRAGTINELPVAVHEVSSSVVVLERSERIWNRKELRMIALCAIMLVD